MHDMKQLDVAAKNKAAPPQPQDAGAD